MSLFSSSAALWRRSRLPGFVELTLNDADSRKIGGCFVAASAGVRHCLIVSLEIAEGVDVDIYTPIQAKIAVPVAVEIDITGG